MCPAAGRAGEGQSRSTRSSPVSDRRFAGTVAGTAPSTAHQIRLNLVADAPISFMFEPPGYQLHLWQQDSGLVTHTAVLDQWPGPAP